MARDILKVLVKLDRIHCYDEGDGSGNAEPYLWTVFFKIDGTGVSLTEALNLSGSATVVTNIGSHGNLGTTDVDAGDDVPVPEAIGLWETTLKPISVPASLSSLVADVGGVVGVVCVLMEEDNVSDDGAESGHQALNSAVQNAFNEIISTLGFAHPDVTEEDINKYTDSMQGIVSDAVKNQQNFFENFWSWINSDDSIGTKVFYFKHDNLANSGVISFSQRWQNEGDWEIFGSVSATVLCPAEAAAAFTHFLESIGSSKSGSDMKKSASVGNQKKDIWVDWHSDAMVAFGNTLKTMRKFRDKEFRQAPGLQRWWAIAEHHIPQLTLLMIKNEELRCSVKKVLQIMPHILEHRNTVLSDEFITHICTILTHLEQNGSRRAKLDASRGLDMLNQVKGKTTKQTFELLNSVEPARHPRAKGVSKKKVWASPKKKRNS